MKGFFVLVGILALSLSVFGCASKKAASPAEEEYAEDSSGSVALGSGGGGYSGGATRSPLESYDDEEEVAMSAGSAEKDMELDADMIKGLLRAEGYDCGCIIKDANGNGVADVLVQYQSGHEDESAEEKLDAMALVVCKNLSDLFYKIDKVYVRVDGEIFSGDFQTCSDCAWAAEEGKSGEGCPEIIWE